MRRSPDRQDMHERSQAHRVEHGHHGMRGGEIIGEVSPLRRRVLGRQHIAEPGRAGDRHHAPRYCATAIQRSAWMLRVQSSERPQIDSVPFAVQSPGGQHLTPIPPLPDIPNSSCPLGQRLGQRRVRPVVAVLLQLHGGQKRQPLQRDVVAQHEAQADEDVWRGGALGREGVRGWGAAAGRSLETVGPEEKSDIRGGVG